MSGRITERHSAKVGDLVKLTGTAWDAELQGTTVPIDYFDGAGAPWSHKEGVGSLGNSAGFYTSSGPAEMAGYEVELVKDEPEVGLIQPTDEQLGAFKRAWLAADTLGLTGQRTRAGLIAVLNMGGGE